MAKKGRTIKGPNGERTREGVLPSGAKYGVNKSSAGTRSYAQSKKESNGVTRFKHEERVRKPGTSVKGATVNKMSQRSGSGYEVQKNKYTTRSGKSRGEMDRVQKGVAGGVKTRVKHKDERGQVSRVVHTRERRGKNYDGRSQRIVEGGKTVSKRTEVESTGKGGKTKYSGTTTTAKGTKRSKN